MRTTPFSRFSCLSRALAVLLLVFVPSLASAAVLDSQLDDSAQAIRPAANVLVAVGYVPTRDFQISGIRFRVNTSGAGEYICPLGAIHEYVGTSSPITWSGGLFIGAIANIATTTPGVHGNCDYVTLNKYGQNSQISLLHTRYYIFFIAAGGSYTKWVSMSGKPRVSTTTQSYFGYRNAIHDSYEWGTTGLDAAYFEFFDTPPPPIAPPDPCATPGACASSVLFLPGIEASRLYRPDYAGGTDKLWEPSGDGDARDLFMDENGESVRHDIYTRDVVDEAYGTLNIYKSFLADLDEWKSSGIMSDYRAVPYDWRVSLDDLLDYGREMPDGRIYYSGDLRATSTPYLVQELRRLAQSSKTGKVTIVAHSNGGLVAKALIQRLQDAHDPLLDKIDSLIMVAVPQAGTPQAIGALLHGYGQAIPFELFHTFLSPAVAREFAHNAPMAHHLLPSNAYFAVNGSGVETPAITFRDGVATNIFTNRYGGTIDSAAELRDFLLGAEGRAPPAVDDLVNPSILSPNLVAYGEGAHASLDTWMPPPSMVVHEIAGWGEDTAAGITYDTDRKCIARLLWACTEYVDTLRYTPDLVVDGDGTVVAPSALAMSTSTENVKRWWVDLGDFNATNRPTILLRNIDHSSILEVPELRSFIRNIITASSTSLLPRYVRASIPPSDNARRLRFFLHSPLALSATDATGNEISAATSTIPGARYRRFGDVQYLSVPAGVAPTLRLDGIAAGSFTLEVQEMRGNTLVATTTFLGIPNATTTTAQMSFSDGTIEHASPLTVDADGDGDTDITLNPRVGETVVPDTTPPEFIITFATSTNALAFLGIDNAGTTTITATTTYPALKKKEKEPRGIATTTVIARDEAGNTTALVYTEKLPSPKGRATIVLQGIAYNSATTTIASTKLSYKWRQNKDGSYKLFASHLQTLATSAESHYRPKKNITVIMTKPRDLDDDDNDDDTDTRPTKERLPGMIIPRMVTDSGEIEIIY